MRYAHTRIYLADSHPNSQPCETLDAQTDGKSMPEHQAASLGMLGDGHGLFLRVGPNGTETWVIEYEFQALRRKYSAGVFDADGAPGSIHGAWLASSRLSLSQARAIAGQWKAERRAGRDAVAEWANAAVN